MANHPKFTTAEIAKIWSVLSEIENERVRQQAKWGEQNHPDGTGEAFALAAINRRQECEDAFKRGVGTWRHIADEEDAEANAESDPVKLRAELVQRAAVCVAWIECIDRRVAK